MRALLSILFLVLCLSVPAQAANRGHEADVAAIRQVVDQFRAAIIARDGKTLGSLFLQDHDSWLSVADEAAWAAVKSKPGARRIESSSWKDFVESVQTSTKPVEERFYNVRIDTNGAVGSVWFDFDFLEDGKMTNRGSESWQMVQTDKGWKISSMLYSRGR